MMQFGLAKKSLYGTNWCGDDAFTFDDKERAVMAVIDGLGHSQKAAAAAQAGIVRLQDHVYLPLVDMMRTVESAMQDTIGGAVAIAIVHKPRGQIEVCGVGSVQLQLATSDKLYRFDSTPGIAGHQSNHYQPQILPYRQGDIIVMYSDGISSSFSAKELIRILHPNPQRLARQILSRYQRGTDDALVLVGWEPPHP